ncbi:YbaB/EbfC family nucleoid-associated protein [Actinoplanes sp. CA-252034]|uniref:YbaB/EbfC family nucleoid-associated protein n=1 Tax=Actinoplanes sp. CA-252034 TaxID=3239906 RepID=UPI003D987335
MNEHGQVATVAVARYWRSNLTNDQLGGAVVEAVRDASARRLTAWGDQYSEPVVPQPTPLPDDLHQRLESITSAPLSGAEREAALVALLQVVESIEQGLDEVSGKMQQTLNAMHTGHSPHREVTVELTGGGDVVTVGFKRSWLDEAHEANLGHQIITAFRAAYEQVSAHGVQRQIADSPLGEAQWVMQDPFGFARRCGMDAR